MKIQELEQAIRLALTGQQQPTLATVEGGVALDENLDGEFANAIRSLAARKATSGTEPDDPARWN